MTQLQNCRWFWREGNTLRWLRELAKWSPVRTGGEEQIFGGRHLGDDNYNTKYKKNTDLNMIIEQISRFRALSTVVLVIWGQNQ